MNKLRLNNHYTEIEKLLEEIESLNRQLEYERELRSDDRKKETSWFYKLCICLSIKKS